MFPLCVYRLITQLGRRMMKDVSTVCIQAYYSTRSKDDEGCFHCVYTGLLLN